MRFGTFAILAAVVVFPLACKEESSNAPTNPRPPVPALPARPTTQQILSGPTKELRLGDTPLILTAPQMWETLPTSSPGRTTIYGPAPSCQIAIRVSEMRFEDRPALPNPEQLQAIFAEAKKRAEQNAASGATAVVRPMGKTHALEQRSIMTADEMGETGKTGRVLRLMNWTITVYAPVKDRFVGYELSFLALPVENYEKDKDFLRRVVDSLRYDESLQPEIKLPEFPTTKKK